MGKLTPEQLEDVKKAFAGSAISATQEEGLAKILNAHESRIVQREHDRAWAEKYTRPAIDPDEGRIRHDRLSRMKTLPELERILSQPFDPLDHELADFAKVHDDLYLLSAIQGGTTRRQGVDGPVDVPLVGFRQTRLWDQLKDELPSVCKALDTATATEGAEYAPTFYSSAVLQQVLAETVIAKQFPEYPMTRGTEVLPASITGGTAYLAGEAITDTPSDFTATTGTTGSVTATAKKIVGHQVESEELESDALVTSLDEIRKAGIRIVAEAVDDACLNGDTTAAHMDSDVSSAADARHAFDGLRHRALVTATGANASLATFYAGNVLGLITGLDQKYNASPEKLVILIPSKFRAKWLLMLTASGGEPVYMRASAMGDQTVTGGRIADFYASPVIMSSRFDLSNSSGYDTGAGTVASCLVTRKDVWRLAVRRGVTVEVERSPKAGIVHILTKWRGCLICTETSATALHTALGYNATV